VIRYRCCRHCEDPCPAIGHTKPCGEEKGKQCKGKKLADPIHYDPWVIRTWEADRFAIPSRALLLLDQQADRLSAAQALSA
jgi:hypothetical protein